MVKAIMDDVVHQWDEVIFAKVTYITFDPDRDDCRDLTIGVYDLAEGLSRKTREMLEEDGFCLGCMNWHTPDAWDTSDWPLSSDERIFFSIMHCEVEDAYYAIVDRRELSPRLRLKQELADLTDRASMAGAEGIWIVRGARNVALVYDNADQPIPDKNVNVSISLRLNITDAGALLLIRFPAEDGEGPGIEFFE